MLGDFSLYKLVNKVFKVVFLALLVGVQTIVWNNAYNGITVQAQGAQRADNSYPMDKWLSSYSKNWCFKLWKLRQNTYKNSRIWCLRILKHRSIDFIVRFVRERKEAIFCLPLFIFIIYCKALGFLAILSIVGETFSIIVQWSLNALKHKCLAFLNILNRFCRILNLSRKMWNKPRPSFKNWRPFVTAI